MPQRKRPTEDQLRDLYERQGLEVSDICAHLEAGQTSVNRWLREYSISLRPLTKPVPDWAPSADQLRHMVHIECRSYASIAAAYNVSPPVIAGWLDKYGIPRAPRARPLTKNKPDASQLHELYTRQRMTTRAIGKRYGVAHVTIRRWLTGYGIPIRASHNGLANRGVEAPTRDELHRMIHEEHLGYDQVAARYGVDRTAIGHWLAKHSIPKPTVWDTRRRGVEPVIPSADELRTRYEAGERLEDLAVGTGVSGSTIAEVMRAAGIPIRPDGWNGGRRWTCTDGHLVRSVYEQRVDDWLTAHGHPHTVEPRLPFDARSRADFLVEGLYIEVWGVTGSASYDSRKARKKAQYAHHGLRLLELPAWAFGKATWRNKLAATLGTATTHAA